MNRPSSPLTEQIRRGLRDAHLVMCRINECSGIFVDNFEGGYPKVANSVDELDRDL